MATLYFKKTTHPNYRWDSVENWWTACDGAGNVSGPNGAIPLSGDTVYIVGTINDGPASPISLANVYIAHSSTGGGVVGYGIAGVTSTFWIYNGAVHYLGGSLSGNATVYNNATCRGIIGNGTFYNSSSHDGGTITGNATFYNNSKNNGISSFAVVNGDATFYDDSNNFGSYAYVNGNTVFNNNSINNGGTAGNDCSDTAVFNDYSYNYGHVNATATFNGHSYNSDSGGHVLCDATFNEDSDNHRKIGWGGVNYGIVDGTITWNLDYSSSSGSSLSSLSSSSISSLSSSSLSSLSSSSVSSVSSISSESSSESSPSSASSQSSPSSSSTELKTSSSSVSTGLLCLQYSASDFFIYSANGCYSKTGVIENERPVYSNGSYYLKFGGESYPRWYLQKTLSLAIHYWSGMVNEPTNDGLQYAAQVGLETGGFIEEGCPSSSSETSQSSFSGNSSYSSSSTSQSFSSNSSSSSSSMLSSSSSYYANLPTEIASYVSTCRGMTSVSNPATGESVGMTVDGFLDESSFSEDETMVYKGGLTRTAANMGVIWCQDASQMFSMRFGMVSVTLRLPYDISNGVYVPLDGRSDSANPDMVIFCVNPGQTYVSQPGLYAALTPNGIEFSVWSSGAVTTIRDTTTSIAAGTDVVLSFAWDHSHRIIVGTERASSVIAVGHLGSASITSWSGNPITPADLGSVYAFLPGSSESTEDWTAPFYLGDMPEGKNGLVGIAIRRIEAYREPYGLPMDDTPSYAAIGEYPSGAHSEFEIGFTATGSRWVGVDILEPEFKPAVSEQVSLLDIGTGAPHSSLGVDAGRMEDTSYPETPTGLPIGIVESKGR